MPKIKVITDNIISSTTDKPKNKKPSKKNDATLLDKAIIEELKITETEPKKKKTILLENEVVAKSKASKPKKKSEEIKQSSHVSGNSEVKHTDQPLEEKETKHKRSKDNKSIVKSKEKSPKNKEEEKEDTKIKYIFVISNIDLDGIDNKYGLSNTTFFNNTTKISELNKEKIKKTTITYTDEIKKIHNCHVVMIDINSSKSVTEFKYNCYWCRHPFNTVSLGCPIKYIPKQVIKQYYSNISKDTYTIKENVSSTQIIPTDKKIISDEREYYETDGIFCSFNCCLAFIIDNKHVRLYDDSESLLLKMYNEVNETKEVESKVEEVVINPAPHWRLLEQYGGYLSIHEFRENFNKVEYEYHGFIKNFKFKPVGLLVEEKIKF